MLGDVELRAEPKSSVEASRPASGTEKGQPTVAIKIYFDDDTPGARQAAIERCQEAYKKMVVWAATFRADGQ